MSEIPFVAFGNDELDKFPPVNDGDFIACPRCKTRHKLKGGMGRTDGGPLRYSTTVLTYKCGKNAYLGAVKGKLIVDSLRGER